MHPTRWFDDIYIFVWFRHRRDARLADNLMKILSDMYIFYVMPKIARRRQRLVKAEWQWSKSTLLIRNSLKVKQKIMKMEPAQGRWLTRSERTWPLVSKHSEKRWHWLFQSSSVKVWNTVDSCNDGSDQEFSSVFCRFPILLIVIYKWSNERNKLSSWRGFSFLLNSD